MSGTDPDGKWFGKKGEPTNKFNPDDFDGAGPLPSDLPKLPGITLQYEIARGGMGVVYSGRQDFLDRRVAVKFLSVDLGGDAFAKRFQREAKILAGISHPNIVGCHMADTTPEGQSYLVMEFIDGPSLKSWIGDNGPVSPLASLRLIRASASALAHAYQSDIIHRDVKPENILLESVTSTAIDIAFPFSPKLVDLGLARMTHEQVGAGLTSPGSVMGTPSTMSPEQFDDPDSVDFRSDIYGLGCCLYEMLVGHPAFRGSKLTDIVVRKRDPKAPNPCEESPQLPAAIGAFTQRLLASAREDRPESYRQLDQEIADLIRTLESSGRDTVAAEPGDALDRTVPSGPGGFRPGAAAPPPEPTRPASGTEPPKAPTSPGMLNTGELDFLSEGVPPVDNTPAFQEASGTVPAGGRTVVTPATPDTGITQPGTPGGGGGKGGLIAIVAVLVLVAGGGAVFFAMNGGGKDPDNGGERVENNGNGGSQPGAANAAPVVEIAAAPSQVNVGERFSIELKATDGDGDELDYEWIWPSDVIHAMSQTSGPNVRFVLDDGLPGVEMTIVAKVSDGRGGEPTTVEHKLVVGNCPTTMPLTNFRAKSEWQAGGTWRQLQHPRKANPGVSGRSRGKIATLGTAVTDDPFWEWSGTLAPAADQDGEGIGMLAVTFGDRGYAVRADCDEETGTWKVELRDRVPGQDEWASRVDEVKSEWREAEDSNNDYAAWVSIRRSRNQLTFQLGRVVEPPQVIGQEAPPPTLDKADPVTVTLSEEQADELSATGRFTLITSRGRCVFKLERR